MLYSKYLKRGLDTAVSMLLITILLPLLVGITLFLLATTRKNPFFVQDRPGLNGKIFKLIKFKTMNDRKDLTGQLLSDTERLTKVGRIMRDLSLDELPQLVNVIKGDMSLIGPRPLLVEYLKLYNEEQSKRHQVRPGITGWAQVNGRNLLSWREKFEYDLFYVKNVSFRLDLVIIYRTFIKTLEKEGISDGNTPTAEKFKGNF